MVSAPLTRRWRLSYPHDLTNSFPERRLVPASTWVKVARNYQFRPLLWRGLVARGSSGLAAYYLR
jgi:hypothetical protein